MTPPPTTERPLWSGSPSPLADLASYVAIVAGAAVFTVGFLVLRRGAPPPAVVGDPDPRRVFAWLIAAAWVACAVSVIALYLRARSVRYELTTERLRVTTGIVSTSTEDLELRRVRDSSIRRPALLRLFGLGDVLLVAGDASTPRVAIRAVRDPDALQSTIRASVQEAYGRFRVREVDVM
jgi:uncharacterized membrane protein YdbT with pleckstrin-like domain